MLVIFYYFFYHYLGLCLPLQSLLDRRIAQEMVHLVTEVVVVPSVQTDLIYLHLNLKEIHNTYSSQW